MGIHGERTTTMTLETRPSMTGRPGTRKRGELFVFGRLLELDIMPYIPLVEVEGIDCIIPCSPGRTLQVQIHTIGASKRPLSFRVHEDKPYRYDCFYVLLSIPHDWTTWIVPASAFLQYATCSLTGKRNIYDLDLAHPAIDAELAPYRENWRQLQGEVVPETVPPTSGARSSSRLFMYRTERDEAEEAMRQAQQTPSPDVTLPASYNRSLTNE